MSTGGIPRRKSAHGRLQSSTSEALENTSTEGAGGKEAAQEERVRSRRVKSAREPRQGRESFAAVFPSSTTRKDASTWGRTQYGDDYGHKQPLKPVPVRPSSPTRRNNPHPAMVSSYHRCRIWGTPIFEKCSKIWWFLISGIYSVVALIQYFTMGESPALIKNSLRLPPST